MARILRPLDLNHAAILWTACTPYYHLPCPASKVITSSAEVFRTRTCFPPSSLYFTPPETRNEKAVAIPPYARETVGVQGSSCRLDGFCH